MPNGSFTKETNFVFGCWRTYPESIEALMSVVSTDMLTLSRRNSPSDRYFLLLQEHNSTRNPKRVPKRNKPKYGLLLLLAIVYGQTGKLIVVLVLTALYTL